MSHFHTHPSFLPHRAPIKFDDNIADGRVITLTNKHKQKHIHIHKQTPLMEELSHWQTNMNKNTSTSTDTTDGRVIALTNKHEQKHIHIHKQTPLMEELSHWQTNIKKHIPTSTNENNTTFATLSLHRWQQQPERNSTLSCHKRRYTSSIMLHTTVNCKLTVRVTNVMRLTAFKPQTY